jgi:hypothetical protein
MAVALYMDVHVPGPITTQLRLRGIDVVTVQDDGRAIATDAALLSRAKELDRLIFTQDILFRAMAENWQRDGRSFAGLLFGPQLGGTIGQYVEDLELIAGASELHEWRNVVQFLPFKR